LTQYGDFSPDGKEFIIRNVATPTPWINYLYNGRYFTTFSNHAGGMSYLDNPLHGRITRYRINDIPSDRPGKYLYLRDKETRDIWSLSWQPVGLESGKYQAVHGFGYTKLLSEVCGVDSEVTFFVPLTHDQEVWKCRLTNTTQKKRRLSLFGYVEFCLGHGHVDLINQCDDQHFNRVYFDEAEQSLFATKTYWVTQHGGTQQQENQEWDQWAFFAVNQPVTGYETLRERFIGPFRNENNPLAVERGELSCSDTDFGNAVGGLQVDIDLAPSASLDIIFSLGVIPKDKFQNEKAVVPKIFHSPQDADQALEEVRAHWDEYLEANRIDTPDQEVNLFQNYWTPYQAKVAFDVGRVASYYYWGISRGFGFRDTSQDTLAITQTDPEKARQRILLLARQMFSHGKVFHHFVADGQGETTGHCDDPFWFILAVTDYIQETGDSAILKRRSPFWTEAMEPFWTDCSLWAGSPERSSGLTVCPSSAVGTGTIPSTISGG